MADKKPTQRQVTKVRLPVGTPLGNIQALNEQTGEFRKVTGEHRRVQFKRWEWVAIAAAPIVLTVGMIILYLIATR